MNTPLLAAPHFTIQPRVGISELVMVEAWAKPVARRKVGRSLNVAFSVLCELVFELRCDYRVEGGPAQWNSALQSAPDYRRLEVMKNGVGMFP